MVRITIQHLPFARSSFVSIPSPRSILKADKLPYMARKWRRVLPRASIDCTPSCLRKLQRRVDDSDELQSDASLKALERLMMGGGAVKLLVVVLHAGGKFGGSSSGYSVSGGLHGVGLSVVNALSEALEVTVWCDGKPVSTLMCHELPDEPKDRQGTHIKFCPDKTIFTTAIQFDYSTIAGRIRELAFLNPEYTCFHMMMVEDCMCQTMECYLACCGIIKAQWLITIALKKEDTDPEKDQYSEYYYAGGLVEYVKWPNTDKKPLHDIVGFRKEADGIRIDVALHWCSDA
ncbi:unnamed protein product [Camellia sinensis]